MSLTLYVLSENNLRTSSFDFYAGEDVEAKLQIYDAKNDQYFDVPSTYNIDVTFPGTPNDIIVANANVFRDPKVPSIFYAPLSQVVTPSVLSGNIFVQVTGPTPLTYTGLAGGNFTVGQTVVGSVSLSTAIVVAVDILNNIVWVNTVVNPGTGTFQVTETLEDSLSVPTITATLTAVGVNSIRVAVLRNGLRKLVSSV